MAAVLAGRRSSCLSSQVVDAVGQALTVDHHAAFWCGAEAGEHGIAAEQEIRGEQAGKKPPTTPPRLSSQTHTASMKPPVRMIHAKGCVLMK